MRRKPTFTRRNARLRARDQSGLTLIEVMVTALIVALLGAATATALINTAKASGHEQFRSEADSLAAQDQDQMRGLSDVQLYAIQNGTARSHGVTLGGITFTVTSTAKLGSASNTAGCTASSASYYETTSTVTWSENGAIQTVSENSLLTRPVFGSLVVQVLDPSNNPILGASVSASTTTSSGQVEQQSAQTNSAGCVIFAGLDAGSYTVSAIKTGYVDVNGNGSTSSNPAQQNVTVSASGASATFNLGLVSGPITATLNTITGAGAEADGLSWSTTGMATPYFDSTAALTTTKSPSTAPNTLYPATYAVWAGRCVGQEPPTTTKQVGSATLTAGGSTITPITEPLLKLTSVYYVVPGSGFALVAPAHLVLTYNDGSCVDSWSATVAAPTSGVTPPATGWLTNPGQPYAPATTPYVLTVCADYRPSSTGTYYYGTSTTSNASYTSTATTVPAIVITKGTNSGQCPITSS